MDFPRFSLFLPHRHTHSLNQLSLGYSRRWPPTSGLALRFIELYLFPRIFINTRAIRPVIYLATSYRQSSSIDLTQQHPIVVRFTCIDSILDIQALRRHLANRSTVVPPKAVPVGTWAHSAKAPRRRPPPEHELTTNRGPADPPYQALPTTSSAGPWASSYSREGWLNILSSSLEPCLACPADNTRSHRETQASSNSLVEEPATTCIPTTASN